VLPSIATYHTPSFIASDQFHVASKVWFLGALRPRGYILVSIYHFPMDQPQHGILYIRYHGIEVKSYFPEAHAAPDVLQPKVQGSVFNGARDENEPRTSRERAETYRFSTNFSHSASVCLLLSNDLSLQCAARREAPLNFQVHSLKCPRDPSPRV